MRSPWSRRASLTLIVPAVMLALSMGAALGAVRIVQTPKDRVLILGSGDGVSILIATETSSVLLAYGTSATDFGNAYAQSAFMPRRDPDIVLLAGTERREIVDDEAAVMFSGARMYTLTAGEDAGFEVPGARPAEELPANPSRLTLDGRLSAVVETVPDPENTPNVAAWRVTIARGDSRIVAVSSQEDLEQFDWSEPSSVAIIAAEQLHDPVSLREMTGATAVVAPAPSVPAEFSSQESIESDAAVRIVPVRPGGLATISFESGGVRLTAEDEIYVVPGVVE